MAYSPAAKATIDKIKRVIELKSKAELSDKVIAEFGEYMRINNKHLLSDIVNNGFPHVGLQDEIMVALIEWQTTSISTLTERVESLEDSLTVLMNQLEYDKADAVKHKVKNPEPKPVPRRGGFGIHD